MTRLLGLTGIGLMTSISWTSAGTVLSIRYPGLQPTVSGYNDSYLDYQLFALIRRQIRRQKQPGCSVNLEELLLEHLECNMGG